MKKERTTSTGKMLLAIISKYGLDADTIIPHLNKKIDFKYRLMHDETGFTIHDIMFGMWEPLETCLEIIKKKGRLTYDDMTDDLSAYDFDNKKDPDLLPISEIVPGLLFSNHFGEPMTVKAVKNIRKKKPVTAVDGNGNEKYFHYDQVYKFGYIPEWKRTGDNRS